MKGMLVLLISMLVSGCSLPFAKPAGSASYTIEPIVIDGKTICCRATVLNSKDYQGLKFSLKRLPDGGMEVALDEKGVDSSTPSSIAAEGQGKLLDALLSTVPGLRK